MELPAINSNCAAKHIIWSSVMGIIDDLTKLEKYFDETLQNIKNKSNIDINEYSKSSEQWRKICNEAITLVTASGKDCTEEQTSRLVSVIAAMIRPVNIEYTPAFIKKPDYYKERWQTVIPENGEKLLAVSKEISLEHVLDNQRNIATDLKPDARTAELHKYIKGLVSRYPELEKINAKLEKGKDSNLQKYDLQLDTETYLSLYKSCKKVELGLSSAETEVQNLGNLINKKLPLFRRLSSKISKIKDGISKKYIDTKTTGVSTPSQKEKKGPSR